MADTDLLAEAVQRLDQAVTRMFGPTLTEHGPTPSLWATMCEAIHDRPHTGTSGQFATGPAAWLDAIDWCTTIETTVRGWAGIHDDPQTILDGWCTVSAWRPQDADTCAGYADTIHTWCKQGERLLSGQSVMEMPDIPCPRCERSYWFGNNHYGETVKKPALEVTVETAYCRICTATWEPLFLARLVGADMPKEIA